MNEAQRLRILLEKLNTGRCSEEELAELESILENRRHRIGDILEEDWKTTFRKNAGKKSHDHQERWQQIKSKITSRIRQRRKKAVIRILTGAAASVAIFLAVWLGVSYFTGRTSQEYIRLTNTSAEPMKIDLPDGTCVVLAKNSEIRYPEHFTPERRDVHLQGKAWYEVAHAPDRPFTVYTDHLSTTVLGTSFVIDTRLGKDSLNISLLAGQVVVKPEADTGNQEWLLEPGEALTTHISDYDVRLHTFRPETALEWTRDSFGFDDRPLEEVLALLEQDYDIEFEYDKEIIGACRITGKFDRFGDLEDILKLIFFPIDLQYRTADSTVYQLYGKGCK